MSDLTEKCVAPVECLEKISNKGLKMVKGEKRGHY